MHDITIIGGGINGCAVARDAARLVVLNALDAKRHGADILTRGGGSAPAVRQALGADIARCRNWRRA